MTIKRWSPSNEGTFEYSDGRYVLYTDILAILAERDSLLNEVAELKQELSRYREALEEIQVETYEVETEQRCAKALKGGKP
jgi:chorismate mutase